MSFLIPDINTFFLLHTHFFSLLVYHVPILSCNPTVYTLCTVSTWGSVYIRKNQFGIRDQRPCNSGTLFLTTGNFIWKFIQNFCDLKSLRNRADFLFHLTIIFSCKNKWKINIISQAEGIQQIKILKNKSKIFPSEC